MRGTARRDTLVVLAVLAIVGAAAYANALPNPFVLDDEFAIRENPQIRQILPLSVPLSPPDETAVSKRPLVNLSLAINYAFGGLDVRGYRAVNLFIFVAAAATLFGLVRRTLWLDGGCKGGDDATAFAAAAAVIWLVHPLNTEVVNYVSQRSQSLMGLCYLLTLYCAVRWVECPRWPGWHVAAVAACAAGMACKESMVTAPLLVAIFDRTFFFDSFRSAFRVRRWLYGGLASCWLLLGMLMLSGSRSTVGFNAGVDPWVYLLNQAHVVATYFRMAVWPHALVVDYGQPRILGLADVGGEAAIVAIMLLAALAAPVRWPRAGFLAVSVFVLLAPTSTVVPIVSEVGAERRMFLPLAAIVVLLVGAIEYAARSPAGRTPAHAWWSRAPAPVRRGIAVASVAVVGAALLLATSARNREYRSALVLAQTTVDRRPHGRALYWLGVEQLRAGRRGEGIHLLHQSAADFAPARFALGTELMIDGDLTAGITQLRLFIDAMPDRGEATGARLQVAMALLSRGDHDEAIAELRTVLSRAPANRTALTMIGEALLRRGNSAEAVGYLEEALAQGAGGSQLHDLLGLALADLERFDQAASHFRRAVELDPSSDLARTHLAAAEARTSSAM